jgi:O-antigen/teichoic acid export membrane protein
LLNLIGLGAPVLVGILTIPSLVANLGRERFALLSLAWTVVGYFGFLDLGLGRATTRAVSSAADGPDIETTAALVWAGNRFLLGIGALGALLVAGSAAWFGTRTLPGDALKPELAGTYAAVALCVPLVTLTSGLRGILEGLHRFDIVTALRTPLGIANFAGPWLVSLVTPRLDACMYALLAARLLGALAYWAVARRLYPQPRSTAAARRPSSRTLLAEGGWLTLSSVIGPLMVSFDRFLVAAMLGVATVAFYSAPAEVVSRFGILPTALATVLFPSFARALRRDRDSVAPMLGRSLRLLFAATFPLYAVVIGFAPEWMRWWLGREFEMRGTSVLQILALGAFINGLAFVPSALLQSAGRARLTAQFHALELPLYIGTVVGLTARYGLTGTAIAWTGRAALDCGLVLAASDTSLRPASVRRSLPLGRHGLLLLGLVALSLVSGATAVFRVGSTGLILLLWLVLVGRDLPLAAFGRTVRSEEPSQPSGDANWAVNDQ